MDVQHLLFSLKKKTEFVPGKESDRVDEVDERETGIWRIRSERELLLLFTGLICQCSKQQ